MIKSILVSLLVMATVSSAFAYRGGRGHHGRGGGYHGGGHHHGGHHRGGHSNSGDFDEGVLVGLIASTSLLFLSEITADHHYAVYLNADNDAAEYLAFGGEPTPALKQAMKYERNFLAKAEVVGSADLSNQDVAYIVMKRAESLK